MEKKLTIKFLYSRRESLTGKSEAYKKTIRAYLEALGYSQTTDSFVEGTLGDMSFYNPFVAPGKKFVVEAKAQNLLLRNKNLARELVEYFRLWLAKSPKERFTFMLFLQGIKDEAKKWEYMFSENNKIAAVYSWCKWYNEKCADTVEARLTNDEIMKMAEFMADTEVTIGNRIDLENAICEKESTSATAVSRMAGNLLKIVTKRKRPIMAKSSLILNILPIDVPESYYVCDSKARKKTEIYNALRETLIPPFLFLEKSRRMMSFANFANGNPLVKFAIVSSIEEMNTREFLVDNPTLGSQLVNIHLRRIMWIRGIYRDDRIFYYPLLEKSANRRMIAGPNGKKRWVVKKLLHRKDTPYAKVGEVNFFFHRAVELRTPTYWGVSYIEIIPRKYYTLDGRTPVEGEIRKRMDARFRNPTYDRSGTRLGLMKFWKYVLFDSTEYKIPPEEWFEKFHFGDFHEKQVDWSPQVIGRDQTVLWDF